MKKQLKTRQLFFLMSTMGVMSLTTQAWASGYQLWEQDGASIGNYHAGRAAEGSDASIGYYNPAGLVLIKNQQLVIGADPILTSFKFDGTVAANTLGNIPLPAKTQGGAFNLVPDAHYAAPLTDNLVFGLSLVAPFGLKTDYGIDTPLRYASTKTSLYVVDLSPSLGFAINDKFSVGAGLDAEHAKASFGVVGTALTPRLDTDSTSEASSNALGFHAGILYQFSSQTRIGLNYQSKVTHHMKDGDSDFSGPLANNLMGGTQSSDDFKTDVILPAMTTLSAFHNFNPRWDLMGTVAYTQWGTIDNFVLENVAGVQYHHASNDITVVIPQNYRNTWNLSVGGNYHLNPQWLFRAGLGYDETPTNDHDRNTQLPDQDRIALALGGHYQATKCLGFDLGWTHYFVLHNAEASINNTQTVGDQVTTTTGDVKDSADVFGLQMKWDIT